MRYIHQIFILVTILILGIQSSLAQAPKTYTSGEIHQKIKRLGVLGKVLYLAAHPDDENTRMISYLANDRKLNTAYLSLTRGDGGQNLLGPEIRELLGVMRTQELLQARRIDGGTQFFSRANDFGFSKNATETLEIWDKKEVLSDVVWTIRQFRPDVIITRFSPYPAKTHGHHTASAILAQEAFDIVNDKTKYSAQLKHTNTWQPKRLLFNVSYWFYGSKDKFKEVDKSDWLKMDVGTYYPLLGKSNNEIAAESRSRHQCQGMGTRGERGESIEYLKHLKGEKAEKDLLEGINTTWTRVEGGKKIGKLVIKLDKQFKADDPAESLVLLLDIRKRIIALPKGHWRTEKLTEIEEIVQACLGVFVSATTKIGGATKNEILEINVEIVNRSKASIDLKTVKVSGVDANDKKVSSLANNKTYHFTTKVTVNENTPFSIPYWLKEKGTIGMYKVLNQLLIGQPENEAPIFAEAELMIDNQSFTVKVPVRYHHLDAVKGDVYEPFVVSPPVFMNLDSKVYIFSDDEEQEAHILLKSGQDDVSGTLYLDCPKNWKTSPNFIDFKLAKKGDEKKISFKIIPSEEQDVASLTPRITIEGKEYRYERNVMDYEHIPKQVVFLEAASKIVRLDVQTRGETVGYLMGAGDDIPNSLEQIGYKVTLLKDSDMNLENLKNLDAVILGVRAYNTLPRLPFYHTALMEYVENGGTLIVQYNTSFRLVQEKFTPYPLDMSRDRVTDETAKVDFLQPNHPVLTTPNKITTADFEGWVQERGLYFPSKWDKNFDAILSCHDPNEPARNGGLLVAKYGKGHYIYTGYSWFRQLPAGVPGAYRVFANLISIDKEE